MHKKLRQEIAKEFRYAVSKMSETSHSQMKLFYFSLFFGAATRMLNREWDSDLVVLYVIATDIHTRFGNLEKYPHLFNISVLIAALEDVADEITKYFEAAHPDQGAFNLWVEHLASLDYALTGNGAYLMGKGVFQV